MQFRNIFTALGAIILVGGLTACDEPSQQGSGTGISPQNQAQTQDQHETQASGGTDWVWPGEPDDPANFVADPNVLRDNIMVVYDGSGSMGNRACGSSDKKHAEGVKALKLFVDSVPSEANLGLYVFDQIAWATRVKLGTGNRGNLHDAIKAIDIGSGTPLSKALKQGYDELTIQAQRQFGYGRYMLVVLTDGEANSESATTEMVNAIVDSTPIEVHTVGFCLGKGHSLNQPGRTFYSAANTPEELINGLQSVLAEASEDDVSDFVE